MSDGGAMLETEPASVRDDVLTEIGIVTFVFPCLDEEEAVGQCVRDAAEAIRGAGYEPDIVVVDNGSRDRSAERAREAGARVIYEARRGYGRAIRTGVDHARGFIIFMADADGTYELPRIPDFISLIMEKDADLVIGNRYHDIKAGAMPLLHRYLGTPVLSFLMRLMFRTGVKDVNCGMRAFTRGAYRTLNLVTTGMEFASEMVIRAIHTNLHIEEVDICYFPRIGESKLRTIQDGLRHLRLMLLYSPDFLFLFPAVTCWVVGAIIVAILYPRPLFIGMRAIDVHTMLVGAMLNLGGLYLGSLGLIAKAYGHFTGLRVDRLVDRWSARLRLKHGLYAGTFMFFLGLIFLSAVVYGWVYADFGDIQSIRELILGLVSFSNGMVIIATSFVLSLMVIPHSSEQSPYPA